MRHSSLRSIQHRISHSHLREKPDLRKAVALLAIVLENSDESIISCADESVKSVSETLTNTKVRITQTSTGSLWVQYDNDGYFANSH